jgi:hypothetical protein
MAIKKTFISVNTMFAELYANAQFQEAGVYLVTILQTSKAYQYGRRCRKTMQSDLLQQDIDADDFIKPKIQSTRRTASQIEFCGRWHLTLPVRTAIVLILLGPHRAFEVDGGRKQLYQRPLKP